MNTKRPPPPPGLKVKFYLKRVTYISARQKWRQILQLRPPPQKKTKRFKPMCIKKYIFIILRNQILVIFVSTTGIGWQVCPNKREIMEREESWKYSNHLLVSPRANFWMRILIFLGISSFFMRISTVWNGNRHFLIGIHIFNFEDPHFPNRDPYFQFRYRHFLNEDPYFYF